MYIIPFLLFSTIVYAEDGPKLTDRESLKFIFGKSSEELNTALSENDFFLHAKGLEYTLTMANAQSEVEWESSTNKDLTGKVVILSLKPVNDTLCKNFMEILNIKDKKYEGNGIACVKDGQWIIDK